MRPESEYSRAHQFRKEVLSDQMIGSCCINLLSWQSSPDEFPRESPEVRLWEMTASDTRDRFWLYEGQAASYRSVRQGKDFRIVMVKASFSFSPTGL